MHFEFELACNLAGEIRRFCEEDLALKSVHLASSIDMRDTVIGPDDGVIVCAAVVGKGSQLLEISRALRDKHHGPRLYVVGFQVAETGSELATLVSNLKHDKTVSHDIARFGCAAVGTQLLASFVDEQKSIYPSGIDLRKLPKSMKTRAELLGGTKPIGAHALAPHGAKVDAPMRLREGWAFWPAEYSAGPVHAETLATMAVLLQRARDVPTLPDDCRLASAAFRHVVLDPENFTRFNDGVLQAAMLRNAYPSELDYRADYASSDFIKSVILRTISHATEEAGEAVLEFLMAIATRRLQLIDDHRVEIVEAAKKSTGRSQALQAAFDHILLPKKDLPI